MCDILSAISYSYYDRPRKRVKINMTIPSRPAPPPPQQRSTTARYTPVTDWDDSPFTPIQQNGGHQHQQQQQHQQPNVRPKKLPPPRPPPPKVSTIPPLKKPVQPQSINILSHFLGQKRGNQNGTGGKLKTQGKSTVPPKLGPPIVLLGSAVTSYGSTTVVSTGNGNATGTADVQLINFDSPPSSPTFTQKSCSDCISVDSFSSDSNSSTPNNGSWGSQAESGFEDDFVAGGSSSEHHAAASQKPSSGGFLWDTTDPFGMPATSGSTTIYAPVSSTAIRAPMVNSKLYEPDFVDPLCNGKSVLPKVPTVSMPTIIKPASQKSTPVHSASKVQQHAKPSNPSDVRTVAATSWHQKADTTTNVPTMSVELDDPYDSLPSLPMPNIPPPPPPTLATAGEEPYGLALYDFEGETDDDLSFKTNEKVYLLKRLNEEWFMGRNKRGLEGMFPANFIEVQVPLSASDSDRDIRDSSHLSQPISSFSEKVRVLYSFKAETQEDLTIEENEFVTVLYHITPEWLYGELHGKRGQFPANYIEYVPRNLPPMPTGE